jgi:hypothetical protein
VENGYISATGTQGASSELFGILACLSSSVQSRYGTIGTTELQEAKEFHIQRCKYATFPRDQLSSRASAVRSQLHRRRQSLLILTCNLDAHGHLLDYGAWKRTKSILDRNNVQDLIGQRELNEDDLMGIFSLAVQDAVSVGLTSVHDGGLNPMSLNFFARYISKPWTYMPKI